jgi:hypothetical protein
LYASADFVAIVTSVRLPVDIERGLNSCRHGASASTAVSVWVDCLSHGRGRTYCDCSGNCRTGYLRTRHNPRVCREEAYTGSCEGSDCSYHGRQDDRALIGFFFVVGPCHMSHEAVA